MGTAARADYKSPDEVAEGRSAHPGKSIGEVVSILIDAAMSRQTKERIRELYEKPETGTAARLLGLQHDGLQSPGP